jgi:hypothetical protein
MGKIPDAVNADRAVDDIATAGGRMVAVGASNGNVAVWTSADGSTWRRGDAGTAGGATARSRFTKVAHGSAGWLAIGSSDDKPLVASSTNGDSWRRVDDKVFVPSPGLTLSLDAVTAGPRGYVIAGTETGGGRSSAAIFTSADLQTWRRADRADLDFTRGSSRRPLGLTVTSSGYVAAGTVTDPRLKQDDQSVPAVWASSDGVRWTMRRPSLPEGATSGYLGRVAAKGNSVTALGVGDFPGGRKIFAVTSNDAGTTWRANAVPMPPAESGSATDVTSLITTANGFLAVGTSGRPRGSDVVLWTSRDGGSWQRSSPHGVGLSGPGIQRINGVTHNGTSLMGVGTTADYRAEHVTLWRRSL